MSATGIAKADWPTFGLDDDIRPALAAARESRQSAVLVTLYAAMEIATGVIAEVYQTLNSADPARAMPLRAISAA
jgi:hypothetical protein